MKTLILRCLFLAFYFGILLPAGLLARLVGRSRFDARHRARGSTWDGAPAASAGLAEKQAEKQAGKQADTAQPHDGFSLNKGTQP